MTAASTEYIGFRVVLMKNIEPRKALIVTRIISGRKKLPLTNFIGLSSRWTTSHALPGFIMKYFVLWYKNLKSMTTFCLRTAKLSKIAIP